MARFILGKDQLYIWKTMLISKHKMVFLFLIIFYFSKIPHTLAISETPAGNHSQNSRSLSAASNFTNLTLSMCDVYSNNSVSNAYCKCTAKVISCDFTNVTSKQFSVVHVSARNITKSIKRICICNTNRNVYIALKKDFLPTYAQVHRIDFCNLSAEIDFAPNSFLNFGGDLYMSKIKYLNKMHNFQFGREDFTVEDVQDLDCCSKIRTVPYERPTLYIENTTIGTIGSNGIYPNHLWKTIIFKFVRIQKGMEKSAIILHDGVNVSFSHSFFNNLSDRAIVADDMANFVMIKSTFNHSCHPLAFGAVSDYSNSTIALIGNRFLNVPQLNLEAKGIINWFNYYEHWDNDTFVIPNTTIHKDRVFSVEFNTVDHFSIQPQDFPAFNNDSNVLFSDNILSLCNCSSWKTSSLPSWFKNHNQRCDAHIASESSTCTLNLQRFMDKCQSNSAPDMNKLCRDSSIRLPLVHSSRLFNLTYKAINLEFKSPFLVRVIKEHETDCLYRMQKVVQYSKLLTYTEEEFEANDSIEYFEGCSNSTDNEHQPTSATDKSSSKTSSRVSAKTIVLIVFSMVLTFVGGISLVYLLKKKFLLRSSRRYMSLNSY